MFVTQQGGKPIKIWLEHIGQIEQSCLEQARNLSKLPFVHKWVALMPDTHAGMGMPIGGVIATKGVVIPASVGVDIGCGVRAVKLNAHSSDVNRDILDRIVQRIYEVIPVGRYSHERQRHDPVRYGILNPTEFISQNWDRAMLQLGTLGGGNHFCELQSDDGGQMWLMIHSGSRKIGHTIGTRWDKIAKEKAAQWCSSIPASWGLAHLPVNGDYGKRYLAEMTWAVQYARANRHAMMTDVLNVLYEMAGIAPIGREIDQVDIAHNYAVLENHYGSNVWVHRKGAVRARVDETVIIPGCQGGVSYIAHGLGNPESFMSCSHGAGRVMSRSKARQVLDLDEEIAKMGDSVHAIRGVSSLDEAPGAYKDIDVVMINQEDLVQPVVRLRALATVKG